MIILNIVLGFMPGSGINNAAHIGGLVTGMILGRALPVYTSYKAERVWKIITYSLVGITVLSYVLLIASLIVG